jgi:hypothetical protein
MNKLLFFILLITSYFSFSQVYYHNFGTTAISGKPYTVTPTTFNSNLSSSSWTTSFTGFVDLGGSTGRALSINNSSGTPTYTLTFNVNSGSQLSITSFSFWRQRSAQGAQNWSMSINGTSVGSGTVPSTGASTGTINVSNPINNLTGTVTVVLNLSSASGTGTFRLDDFTLNGSVITSNSNCSMATSLSLPSTVGATTTTGTQSTCGKENDFPVNSFGSSLYGDGEDAVWEITVPSGGRNLQFDLGGSGTYKILSLHSACTPTNANTLVFGTTSSGTSTSFSRNLEPGTYYLWTDTWPSPTCGQYSITITRLADPLPPSCISLPTSPTNSSTNQSLTPTLSWSSTANATSYDVYFGATLPGTPTTNTASTTYNPGTLLEGTTYYWKIVPKNSAGEPTGCTTWSFTTLSRPINDNPSGAITLTIGTTVSYSTYTNLYATNTTTESTPSCASYVGEDVWFKVTLPQYINSLDFDTQTGIITDGGMSIYRGTPGSLVEIQCDDDSSPNGLMSFISRTDFFEYETIYIRIWEYNGGTTGTFGISITTPQPLPVELSVFDGFPYKLYNVIKWSTESENNSSHFNLESSFDGFFWRNITSILAAGNSTQEIKYSYIDYNNNPSTYYRLQQFDIDGQCKTYGPILVTKSIKTKKIVKYVNLMGQEINPNYTKGIILEIYDDGTMKKFIR